jgi:hypothetical protein
MLSGMAFINKTYPTKAPNGSASADKIVYLIALNLSFVAA